MTAPIEVKVYEPDGVALVADVTDLVRGVQCKDELNTPGAGRFDIHLDTVVLNEADDPVPMATVLAGRNVVRMTRSADSVLLKTWRIESLAPVVVSSGEKADRWCTVAGRGVLADAEAAVVYPEILSQASASEDRAFSFASPSFTPEVGEWVAPAGVAQDSDPTARGTYPRPWVDGTAEWIWPVSATTSQPIGRCWFRGEFTLGADSEILLECAADNYAEVWLDGERVVITDPADPFAWKMSYSHSRTLVAGTHVVAAAVDNWVLSDGGNNPGGFLCTVYTTDSVGERDTNVLRTNTTDWTVKAYGDPPGWTFGDILATLVAEAQGRGVTDLDAFTLGFDGDLDSNGDAWPGDRQDRTLRIGTDLLKVIGEATEVACDVWADDFELNAAPVRGEDRTLDVTFTAGVDILALTPTFKCGPTRNVALVRYGNRWLAVEDSASITEHGRREMPLQLGGAGSEEQASGIADANFVETATPEVTVPLQITSVVGPQPWTDFWCGDVIVAPGLFGEPGPHRVMAITPSVVETHIVYDLDIYPE